MLPTSYSTHWPSRVCTATVSIPRSSQSQRTISVVACWAAWPPDSGALTHRYGELDVHRDFQPGAGDFALSLDGVAVTEEEQRTVGEDRQQHRHGRPEAPVVHVAAV